MSRDFNYRIYDTCADSITSPEQILIDIPGFSKNDRIEDI